MTTPQPPVTTVRASAATNPRAYRQDAATHLYGINRERIWKGKLPPMLYAIGFLFTFGIGGADPAKLADAKARGVELPGNHSPLFAPLPEPSIRTGVEAMTLAVMNVMGE